MPPRRKRDDGFDCHYLEDLQVPGGSSDRFGAPTIRHRDAAPSVKVANGSRLISSCSLIPASLMYDNNNGSKDTPPIQSLPHTYLDRPALNEELCSMDFSPGNLRQYAFDNPSLALNLSENDEVGVEPIEDSRTSNVCILLTELREWHANLIPEYIHELLQLEGRGVLPKVSCQCGAVFDHEQAHLRSYKCQECFDSSLYCAACIIDVHQHNPLHIVQAWNGTFFDSLELSAVGLVIHLGPHSATNPCHP
ncbi:hypothetical protein C8R42DRAFT_723101 [Lentinula raphanica]|nr:hypothetical protein C8R42DRAFT_723101 [Lentinula raphanica]